MDRKPLLLLLALCAVISARADADYTLENTKATKAHSSDVVAATDECPIGYEYAAGSCFKYLEAPPTTFCPKGTKMEDGICVGYDVYKSQHTCPNGYEANGYDCVRTEEFEPTLSCYLGYTLQGTDCVKRVDVPLTTICPTGYKPYAGKCYKHITYSPTKECHAGYELVDNVHGPECRKIDVINSKVVCPHFFELKDGECRRVVKKFADTYCPSGYKLILGKCEQVQTADPDVFCDKGTLHGHTCKDTLVDYPKKECPKDYTMSDHNECVLVVRQPVTLKCKYGYTLNSSDETCTKTVYDSPEVDCPEGYKLVGAKCELRTSTALESACPEGFEGPVNGECFQTELQKADLKCDYGYKLSHDGKTCEKESLAKAVLMCPTGHLSGLECQHTEYVDSESVCQNGVSEGYSDCVKYDTKRPSEKCDNGALFKNGKCELLVKTQKELVCPDNSVKEGDHCKVSTKANPEIGCPDGYQLQGYDRCSRTDEVQAIKTCPKGYTLNHDGLCTSHWIWGGGSPTEEVWWDSREKSLR